MQSNMHINITFVPKRNKVRVHPKMHSCNRSRITYLLRDGPFDIRGGWDFFEKNSLFSYRSEKNKMSSMQLKIKSLFFIQ